MKDVSETLWAAQARIGSTEYPAQSGNRFELWAIVVDSTVAGSPPVGELPDLSVANIPGRLAISEKHTLTVDREGTNDNNDAGEPCKPVEARLFDYLETQQHPSTGFLESFTFRADLPQEFRGYLQTYRPAFVYDNALAAIAYLDRGLTGDLDRARRILDAFVISQGADGRVPDAVNAHTAEPIATDYGTGNQMWAVLALVKGHEVLDDSTYLDAAERAGNFVLKQKNSFGYGGFVLFPGSTIVGTEHNVDAYSGFSLLAAALQEQGNSATASTFDAAAAHARVFVESRFDPVSGKTFTGTDDSGVDTNTFPVPEDTQTWTLMALGGTKWRRGYDWLLGRDGLWTTSMSCPTLDGITISGSSFSDADTSEVWFEGLAHVWVAATLVGDVTTAESAELTSQVVQKKGPNSDGSCLIAACDTLETGFGFSYFNTCAVAPTAWAVFGFRELNPLWCKSTTEGLSANPGASVPWVATGVPPNAVFPCPTGGPCTFMVSGTSSGVASDPDLAIYALIRPSDPSAGATYTQFPAASVQTDGTWSASAALGSSEFPASTGDEVDVSAMIVDTSVGSPPAVLTAVTRDDISGLVAVTGILHATVQVEP